MTQKYIPYGTQEITSEDIDFVTQSIRSAFLTQGPLVPQFEEALAKYGQSKYAILVNSATSALHIACLALGLTKDDYVWTSPISFVASSNCALYCGAKIDFVDIDINSNNMSVVALENKLKIAELNGKLPKIVIPVHMAGFSCDMESIGRLSKKYGFHVIEDASHAIGGRYLDRPIGCGIYSDIVIFSFHPVKIITTGEGGAALTNCEELANQMRLLRSHGITRDPSLMQKTNEGGWHYEQIALGFNYRMTEMQAALGISQLQRVDSFVKKRQLLAKKYHDKLKKLPLLLPIDSIQAYSSYHLYIVKLMPELVQFRKNIFDAMRNKGIGVNLHYIPIYQQPFYKKFQFNHNDYPSSEQYYSSAITLPLFTKLMESEQDFVVDSLVELIS